MQLSSYKIEIYHPIHVGPHRCPSSAIEVEGTGHDRYLHCLMCSWMFYEYPPDLPDPEKRLELQVKRTYGTTKCLDCGAEIVKYAPNTVRCRECAKKRRYAKERRDTR